MSSDIIERLQQLLQHFSLSSSQFADQIGVPRSSMSHLMSGRNKPSLDFILKVISKFPEVNLYWLLNGKGAFLPNQDKAPSALPKTEITKNKDLDNVKKKVRQVMVFYEDGTFESYNPSE
ncbi:helix-turn-helix domain-containing protein [Croceitalea vernalis]|uniref:Helix-turn-helix transcriptional regulator n=1 Tax=Croceitalea vernalis TaxID=3075599 RepID=A0ABU3BH10_9FLAO|nr:helix-turn-helix transcriptional regulator [Croceitalea sp. P007]MDT0621415.1 helix-turn-helix transcriptional regulator [Croceitalea sp. P007]